MSALAFWAQDLKDLLNTETTWLFSFLPSISFLLNPFSFSLGFSISLLRIGPLLTSFSPQATLSHLSHYKKIPSVEQNPRSISQPHSFVHPGRTTFLRNSTSLPFWKLQVAHWSWLCFFIWVEGIIIPKPSSKWGVTHFWLILFFVKVFCQIPLFCVQNCPPSMTNSKWPKSVMTETRLTWAEAVRLNIGGNTFFFLNLKLMNRHYYWLSYFVCAFGVKDADSHLSC